MTTIEEIEKAVAELTPEQLAKFRAWFDEFQERMFDEQIERDAKAGKLDRLISKARENHDSGRPKSSDCPFGTVMPAKAGIQ
jgi:hypothetical protein